MALDIIFECETAYQTDEAPNEDLLQPDEAVINVSEKRKGYYEINSRSQTVDRNEAFIAFKLNFLAGSESHIKKLSFLLKKMVSLSPENRPDIETIIHELDQIQTDLKALSSA